jgi:hypothetical protein
VIRILAQQDSKYFYKNFLQVFATSISNREESGWKENEALFPGLNFSPIKAPITIEFPTGKFQNQFKEKSSFQKLFPKHNL